MEIRVICRPCGQVYLREHHDALLIPCKHCGGQVEVDRNFYINAAGPLCRWLDHNYVHTCSRLATMHVKGPGIDNYYCRHHGTLLEQAVRRGHESKVITTALNEQIERQHTQEENA